MATSGIIEEEGKEVDQAEELKYGIEKYSGPNVPTFRIIPEVDKLKSEGAAHLGAGRMREATTQYRSAAALLATAYGKAPNKEWERARLDPLRVALFLNLSLCYLRTEDPRGAAFFARKALQVDAGSAKAWYRLAMAYAAAREHEKAQAALERAAAAEPGNADVRRELARVREEIARTRRAQGKVFATMLSAVTTPEDEQREREERKRREAIAKRTEALTASIKPLPEATAEPPSGPPKPKMPLMEEIDAVSRNIDETENELRQLLMGRVREEKLADVEAINEDLDEWNAALKRMSFQERIGLAREMVETRKLMVRAADHADKVKIPETVARFEAQYMDALQELKERAEDAGDEEAVAKLAKAKDKLLRLVRRFDFAGTLQRVVDMSYSCAVGRDIASKEGNIHEVLDEFGTEPPNGGF
jgi:tetratricopeptide (TPR) repeat protein